MGMSDIDPLADPVAPVPAQGPVSPAATSSKKIKVPNVTDQMDDTEVDLMSRTEIDQTHMCHVQMTGAEPADECEPTGEQLAAMQDRIVKRGDPLIPTSAF